ncbi:MAG: hypothetical protein DRN91_05760 [Candidatus Alkanophagales archaeon]|nr:MAG: hypothetical protein DRN91_05760 [Candidatus Alkanophagales archaeon]
MERKEDIGRMHTAGLTIDFEYGELWRGLHRSNPLSFKKPFSFTVYKDRDVYMAEDWRGRVRYEDDDASEVIQGGIDALSDGGTIFLKFGRYNLYSKLTVKEGVLLKGEYVGSGAYPGSPRTLLVNYFDDHVIELEPGSAVEDIHIAKGVDPFTHSMIHITECDFNKPIWIRDVFGSSDLYSDGDFILLEITKSANIIGVIAEGLRWYGFENGIHLLGNPDYSGNVISGNIFTFMGKYSYIFVKMERNGGGYQSGNKFTGIMQCGSGTERGVVIDGNANEFHISSFDIPSGKYDVEVVSGARGNIVSGWFASVLDNGTRTKIICPYHFENSGIAVFSGDGTTTTFNIEHGLVSTPSKYGVDPLTPDAHGSKTITVDDTYITITFDTAPPSGTDNLKFSWWAKV